MSEAFLRLINLSITTSWLILTVIIARLILKKAPKWIHCALWALVALRLVCPFTFESALSLIPNNETIPYDIASQHVPAIDTGISSVNHVINPIIADGFTSDPVNSANPLQILIPVASGVWLVGMTVLLLYALISYLKLKKSVGVSIVIKDNIKACDEVSSPFILGFIKPVIYLPSSMNGETLSYVINHETTHIMRHDHWWKPLGYLLLTVYWFNPLCWIAYVLLCRDIELACDERVIRDLDRNEKAAYSQALLNCNFPRKRVAACPLAFGAVGVKERVKSVLNYKKPTFWVTIVALVICIVVAVCFLTNPKHDTSSDNRMDNVVHAAVDDSAETAPELVSDDWEKGNHAPIGGTLTTTEYHWYSDMQYTLHGIKVFDSFAETGIDPEETVDSSMIEKYSQECKLVVADFTVKYVGSAPISPEVVKEKGIFLDMRLYSGLTEDSEYAYMSEPYYFSAHDDEHKKYYFMPVSQPGDTLDFQVAFFCKEEYIEQTETTIAILSTTELENSLYFDIFGSNENEVRMESKSENESIMESESSESESGSSEPEWAQQENHYLVGEPVRIFVGDDQQEVECVVVDVTPYDGGYVEAGMEEWVEQYQPEVVEYQDQAGVDVRILVRSMDEKSINYEELLEKLQIVLTEGTDNKILYPTTIGVGKEGGNIRPDGYEGYGLFYLCPKEVMHSPFLCLTFTGDDITDEVFFDISVTTPDFDPDQYDTRFMNK